MSGSTTGSPSLRQATRHSPSRSSSSGTSYRVEAVTLGMTQSSSTLQNRAIFRRMSPVMGLSVRHTRMSGWMPMLSSSFTECWVGLLFSSPLPGMDTISGTWMYSTFSLPFSAATCRMASRKGWLSMSPTVPPISEMTTSVCPSSMA